MKLLVIGSDSFIAKNFIQHYAGKFEIKAISRAPTGISNEVVIKDLSKIPDSYFKNQSVVLNFAAIVHQTNIKDRNLYEAINYKLTVINARKAKDAGVNLFIQMSTIAVYGDAGYISLKTPYNPQTPYGISKLKADKELIKMQDKHFKVAIVRPPLVYGGKKTPGNMMRLIKLADKKLPLPFKGVNNKRDFINIKNLIQYLAIIAEKKLDGIHLLTDNCPVSMEYLLQIISKFLNKKIRLIKLPEFLLKMLKSICPFEYNKLFESLEISSTFTKNELISYQNIEDGIQEMVEYYKCSLKC